MPILIVRKRQELKTPKYKCIDTKTHRATFMKQNVIMGHSAGDKVIRGHYDKIMKNIS